jgi:hypothetical protein
MQVVLSPFRSARRARGVDMNAHVPSAAGSGRQPGPEEIAENRRAALGTPRAAHLAAET